MKKIIYAFLSDSEFGIKTKTDIKARIYNILDRINTRVSLEFDGPIEVTETEVESFNIFFVTRDEFEKEGITGTYDLTGDTKTFRLSLLPSAQTSNLVEDYTIIEHSNGVTEYKTRIGCQDNNEYKEEYYFNGQEITKIEAKKLLKGKSK